MSLENQNAPNPENLSLDQLSPELMEKISEALAYPVIALCPDGQQIGSGVLVEVDGVSGILTAEHVIFDKRFQRATGLWTSPHLHSLETRDEPTTHFTSTNIQMDLVRCYPEEPQVDENNPRAIHSRSRNTVPLQKVLARVTRLVAETRRDQKIVQRRLNPKTGMNVPIHHRQTGLR
jgi:hypothetical protein